MKAGTLGLPQSARASKWDDSMRYITKDRFGVGKLGVPGI